MQGPLSAVSPTNKMCIYIDKIRKIFNKEYGTNICVKDQLS